MQYSLYEIKDNAEGQLDSSISASDLVIPLKSGEGTEFPTTYTGNTTSLGTSTTLNKTSIGASGITVGQFIENITDGSHAYVTAVDTNSLTTTTLEGGSDNTWQNNDEYAVGMFIITLNKRNLTTGEITQSEKVKIKSRATDTLTAITGGRGFDGSTAAAYAADDYVSLFVTAKPHQEVKKAIAEQATNIKGLQATAPSALEKAALARLLDFDLTYSALSLDVDVEGGVYNNDGDAASDTPLTLAASQTNYIEVNQSTGVISSNTTSFNVATSLALWLVTTDGTGVTAVVDKRQVYGDYPGGATTPTKLEETLTASGSGAQGDIMEISASDTVRKARPTPALYRYMQTTPLAGSNAQTDTQNCYLGNGITVSICRNSSNYPSAIATRITRLDAPTVTHTNGAISSAFDSSTSARTVQIIKMSSTQFLVFFYKGATSRPSVIAGEINTSTLAITLGSPVELSTSGSSYSIGAYLSTNLAVCVYHHSSGKYARTLSLSGTTITANTEYQLTTNTTSGSNFFIWAVGATKAYVMYYDGTNTAGRVLSVSGTSLTLETAATAISGSVGLFYGSGWGVSAFQYDGTQDLCYMIRKSNNTTINVTKIVVSGTGFAATTTSVTYSAIGDAIMGAVIVGSGAIAMLFGDYSAPATYAGVYILYESGGVYTAGNRWLMANNSITFSMGSSVGNGITYLETGELYCTHSDTSNNYGMFQYCLRPVTNSFGVASEAYTDTNPVDTTTYGLCTVPSLTAGSVAYYGYARSLNHTETEATPVGIIKTTTSMRFTPKIGV